MNTFNNYKQADKVIVSVSSGKDSLMLMLWAVRNIPKHKLICVHAKIDLDWAETLPLVKRQCKAMGLPLIVVEAVDKTGATIGFLDVLQRPRIDRKTKLVKENMFPFGEARWCTAILKTGPIDKVVRKYSGNVLVLIGERHQESNARAKLAAWRPDKDLSAPTKNRRVVKFSPILKMLEVDVWKEIKAEGLEIHPCYGWGVSRASCAICIYSSDKEIALAAKHAPKIVMAYLNAEATISHTFRYKAPTKKREALMITVADILETEKVDLFDLMKRAIK